MKNWHPDIDLDRLLAALAQEVIDTSDEDIRALCGQVGPPLSGVARDMHARIATIIDADIGTILLPSDMYRRCDFCIKSH